jgi:tetratricopeptide (TPR) repeat protein
MTTQTAAALFQAGSFLDIGQPQRAVDVLTAALKADPQQSDLLAQLSRAYLLAGDDDAAEQAAEAAQTAAGRPRLQSLITLINVAHHRLDHHRVCELARAVVAQWPSEPQGHIWYALGMTRLATTDDDRAVVRRAVATALELGDRSPLLLRNAAWIESRFGNRDGCLAHVDEGLASDPSNADLLKLRAWAVKDAKYSAKVMLGILAIDPMDSEASTSLERAVEARRAVLVRLIFLAPFLFTIAVLVPPVMPRTVAIVTVIAYLQFRAAPHVRYLRALPPAYVRTRWQGEGRTLIAASALIVTGTALFAAGVPVAGPLVMAAGLATWGRAAWGTVVRKVEAEVSPDSQELVLQAHAVWSRSRATTGAVVGGFALLIGWQYLTQADAGGVGAPLSTLALLGGVTTASCMAILGWIGKRRGAVGTLVSAVVFGVVGVGLAGGGAVGVIDATTGSKAGRYEQPPPPDEVCRRGRCYDLSPDPPTAPTITPFPTVSIPPFTMPTFDVPEVPDLDGSSPTPP